MTVVPDVPTGWLGTPFVAAGGALFLAWWARRTEPGPWLRTVVLASYGFHLVLATALYLISYWRLPVLPHLQYEPGFWMFGPDAYFFHHAGWWVAEDWARRRAVMDPWFSADFYVLIAAIYAVLGRNPLYPIFCNCFLASASGLLAYGLGRRLFGQSAARWSALLVMFWPSSIMWSVQLLRDPFCWFFMILALSVMLALLPAPSGWLRPLASWLGLSAGLGLAIFALTGLREYLGIILAFCFTVTAVCIGLRQAFLQARWVGVGRLAGVAAVLWASVWVAGVVDPRKTLLYIHWQGTVGSKLMPNQRGEWVPDPVAPRFAHPHPELAAPVSSSLQTPEPETASPATLPPPAASTTPLHRLLAAREGFIHNQGHSVIDPDVRFTGWGDVARYMPRALSIALFAPFPSQWFETGGSTGIMRSFASVEMAIIYALFPGFLIGLWHLLKHKRMEGALLGMVVLAILAPLGLTVNTLGILFRLRLPAILLMGVIAGGALESREKLATWLRRVGPCVDS